MGTVHYPYIHQFHRFWNFLLYFFCCDCFCCKLSCCNGDADEEEPTKVVSEFSWLMFTSRIDFLSIQAFTAPAEKIRFFRMYGWSGIFPRIANCIYRNLMFAWERLWMTEFGVALLMFLATGASFGLACNAAGQNGDPMYFAYACAVFLFVMVCDIFAIIWHICNRSTWMNALHPTYAQTHQLERWWRVMILWIVVTVFLIIALIAGAIFLKHEYSHSPNWSDWSPRQRLMCDSWDDAQGIEKPYHPHPEPIPTPATSPSTRQSAPSSCR